MAWTYILECRDGTFYVGSTTDLERRLAQHQAGEGAAYTRRRRPVRLVYAVECPDIRSAYALEKQVEGWSRLKRLALIAGRFDLLTGLARRRTFRARPQH